MTTGYCWSDLPDDLLCLVYAKVVGLLQRVRFASVCTSWRASATVSRYAAPTVLPWHISSFGGNRDRTKRMYCPEDGEVFAFRVPNIAVVRRFVGAHDGGWIAALTRKHVKLVLVNLFSGVEVPLSVKQRKFVPTSYSDGARTIRKIVFSQVPTSNDCILVALTSSSNVALCRVGCPDEGWIMTKEQSRFMDIAFCDGKLFGLTTDMELGRFDITNKDGDTSVVFTWLLSIQHAPSEYIIHPFNLVYSTYIHHLFDLDGKLTMVRTWWSYTYTTMPLFKVFQLAYHRHENKLMWAEVTSLGEHALFLGETCSKAVRVPAGGYGQVERNCIYSEYALYFDNGSCLYQGQQNGRGEGVRRIKVAHVSQHGMWLIPPSV